MRNRKPESLADVNANSIPSMHLEVHMPETVPLPITQPTLPVAVDPPIAPGVRIIENGHVRAPSAMRRRRTSAIRLDPDPIAETNVLQRLEQLKLDLAQEQQRVAKDLHRSTHTDLSPMDSLSSPLALLKPRPPRKWIEEDATARPDSRVSSLNLDALERLTAARLNHLRVR